MMPSMSTHRTTRVLPRARSTDMTIAAVTMMNSIVGGYRKTRATQRSASVDSARGRSPQWAMRYRSAWSLLPTLSAPSELTRASPARLNEFSPFHRVVLRLLLQRAAALVTRSWDATHIPSNSAGGAICLPTRPLSGSSFTIHYRPLRSHPSAQACAPGTPGCRGRAIAVEACCVRRVPVTMIRDAPAAFTQRFYFRAHRSPEASPGIPARARHRADPARRAARDR
jgi:hypothetical protein